MRDRQKRNHVHSVTLDGSLQLNRHSSSLRATFHNGAVTVHTVVASLAWASLEAASTLRRWWLYSMAVIDHCALLTNCVLRKKLFTTPPPLGETWITPNL